MDDAALDALLRQARWPELAPGAERRLGRHWRALQTNRSRLYVLIAASVLIVLGVWTTLTGVLRQHRATPLALHNEQRGTGMIPPAPGAAEPPAAAPAQFVTIVWRAPTAVELAILRVRSGDAAAHDGTHIRRASPQMPLASLLAGLTGIDPDRFEGAIRQALRPSPRRLQSAAKVLAATASIDQLPLLLWLDRDPTTRPAAVTGLARVAPWDLLAILARTHQEAQQRRRLLAAMLARDPQRAAGAYLEFVRDEQTRDLALAVLDDVPVPSDAFFVYLNDRLADTRRAAARVLARIDGPRTTAILVALAERNQNRREALLALAESRGPEARRFLQLAGSSGPLSAVVRSVLHENNLN